MNEYFRRNDQLWLVILCTLAFGIPYFSPVSPLYAISDPLGSLLTSQSILEHGTIKLDAYADTISDYPWQVQKKNDHYYYGFPIGTSLYAVPFVWLANLRGENMAQTADQDRLQRALSSLTTLLSCLLIYLIARCCLNHAYSFLLSATFVFGSAIASTMGAALWSMNLTVVFVLLSLLLLIYEYHQKTESLNTLLLGFFMFSAYICRPTAAIFVSVVFIYILLKNRLYFLKLAATCALLFGAFVLFSLVEYKQVLPDYYLPSRLGSSTFWLAMYGNLLSPGRGLLVYSPYLLLTFAGAVYLSKRLYQNPFFWITLSWFALHLVTISRFRHWWGGGSFGSRLLTDALPGLAVLTFLVWREALTVMSQRVRRTAVSLFSVLAVIGVFINTYQGLYNFHTFKWNAFPHVDENPELVFNWKYPQFLASPRMLERRTREHQLKAIQPYTFGEKIIPDSENVLFEGWHPPEGQGAWRWSAGKSASITFKIAEPFEGNDLALQISANTYQTQTVDILVNDIQVGSIESQGDQFPTTYVFPVDASILQSNRLKIPDYRIVQIEFLVPGAVSPYDVEENNRDRRILGICIREVKLSVVQSNLAKPTHYLNARFADKIELLGYDLETSALPPANKVHLVLYWQALAPMSQSYTVFTHLIDDEGRIWGQVDQLPGGSTHLTTDWRPGEVVRDEYFIPVGEAAPAGEYRLEIGLYSVDTMQRLDVLDRIGNPQDQRVLLGPITVER